MQLKSYKILNFDFTDFPNQIISVSKLCVAHQMKSHDTSNAIYDWHKLIYVQNIRMETNWCGREKEFPDILTDIPSASMHSLADPQVFTLLHRHNRAKKEAIIYLGKFLKCYLESLNVVTKLFRLFEREIPLYVKLETD